ncbi:MAG: hypothetical protein GW949_05195 [Spirochaetales bacterium]|nr:hypothetical protein [Spirochaetales bacterium]
MGSYRLGVFFLLLLFVVGFLPLYAQSFRGNSAALANDVRVTVWYDREAFPPTDFSRTWEGSPGDSSPALGALEMARNFVSGMIYGYTYSYVPPDLSRRVTEEFILEPANRIPWGDERLSLEDYRDFESWVQMTFRYRLSDEQVLLRRRWLGVQVQNSRGLGQAPLSLPPEGTAQAFEAGFLQAVRTYARGITQDKPAEISGRAILADSPRIWSDKGQFMADVKIQLTIDDLRYYEVF